MSGICPEKSFPAMLKVARWCWLPTDAIEGEEMGLIEKSPESLLFAKTMLLKDALWNELGIVPERVLLLTSRETKNNQGVEGRMSGTAPQSLLFAKLRDVKRGDRIVGIVPEKPHLLRSAS